MNWSSGPIQVGDAPVGATTWAITMSNYPDWKAGECKSGLYDKFFLGFIMLLTFYLVYLAFVQSYLDPEFTAGFGLQLFALICCATSVFVLIYTWTLKITWDDKGLQIRRVFHEDRFIPWDDVAALEWRALIPDFMTLRTHRWSDVSLYRHMRGATQLKFAVRHYTQGK